MDISKLASRKLWVGGGAILWTMFQEETDPNRLAAMSAIAITYLVIEGIKDAIAAKNGTKPAMEEGQ